MFFNADVKGGLWMKALKNASRLDIFIVLDRNNLLETS